MAAPYLHLDLKIVQSARDERVCGDVAAVDRDAAATTLICADGLGHGVRARVAAQMMVTRLRGLLAAGFSPHRAFARVVETMNQARGRDPGYTAFTMTRIRADGQALILGYEVPAPLLLSRQRRAIPLEVRVRIVANAMIGEATCFLEAGEALILLSDGITQAGLGPGAPDGWTSAGVAAFVNARLATGLATADLATAIHQEALRRWQAPPAGDDCTVMFAACRHGHIATLLTGPPNDRRRDGDAVRRLCQASGSRIVCGGTTAAIVARLTGNSMRVEASDRPDITPPRYELPDIDLVTEGAVTLNQVCNLLTVDPADYPPGNPAGELAEILLAADRVDILLGAARNPIAGDVAFRQLGILDRDTIVHLLADRLRAAGKLVTIERF